MSLINLQRWLKMDRENQIKLINSWLKEVSLALDIQLKLDDQGICTFKIAEDIMAIEASYDYAVVNIYSPLIALPTDNKKLVIALQARALELNAFQICTRGGAIATPPGGGFLIYCISLPTDNMDTEKFSEALGAFYETLPELRKMLLQSDKEPIKKSGPQFQGLKI